MHKGDNKITPPYLLGKAPMDEMMKEWRARLNSRVPSVREQTHSQPWREQKERIQSTRARGGEMAASSSRNLTVEERLKKLDETLEKLKQTLQYQLDFLENLDTEAGRRLEHLEQDISTVKIGFTEELGKLH
jgi:hypothetical protein